MRPVVEGGAIAIAGFRFFVDVGEDAIGALHFGEGEEGVLVVVEDEDGLGDVEAEDFGVIEVAGQGGDVAHPGVGVGLIEQIVAPGGHHADADGDFDAGVEAGEHDGAEATAGEAAAADAVGVDVGAAGEVVGGAFVVGGEDAGPGEAGAEEAFGDFVFVAGGELVVAFDLVGVFGVDFAEVAAEGRGDVAEADAAAAEGEGVVDEDGVTAFGELVGPGEAAVVMVLVVDHERMGTVTGFGDFAEAEVLVAAVVVEADDAGEFAFGAAGFEEEGLGGRSVGELPLEFLDGEAVVVELALDGDVGGRAGGGLEEGLPVAFAGEFAPGVEVGVAGVAERKARRIGGEAGGPFTVGAQHVFGRHGRRITG